MNVDSTDIAEFLDAPHEGLPTTISGVGSLANGGSGDLAFSIHQDPVTIHESAAGAVICRKSVGSFSERTVIRSSEPRLDFMRAVNEFFNSRPAETRIHPSAVVDPSAEVGNRCVIGPHVYVGEDVVMGDKCRIQAGTVIGKPGYAFVPDGDGTLMNQIHEGTVVLEDNVFVGSNCTIDSSVFDATRIGRGSKLHNLIHVAHNVEIGEYVRIHQHCSLAGSVRVADRVLINANASIADHRTVGEEAVVGMNAGVLDDVPPGETVVGTPARPLED